MLLMLKTPGAPLSMTLEVIIKIEMTLDREMFPIPALKDRFFPLRAPFVCTADQTET